MDLIRYEEAEAIIKYLERQGPRGALLWGHFKGEFQGEMAYFVTEMSERATVLEAGMPAERRKA